MALDVRASVEQQVLLEAQTAWGTAITDANMLTLQDCEHTEIVRNTASIDLPRNTGTRNPDWDGKYLHEYGVMPTINLKTAARQLNLDKFLYLQMQSVTEGAATPYSKAFVYGDADPDFTADAGYFASVGVYNPASTGGSAKIYDAVGQSLKLTISPGGILMVDSALVAPHAASSSFNPTGTLVHVTDEFWHWHNIARFMLNDGTAFNLIPHSDIEIELTHDVVGIGVDGSGAFESVARVNRKAYLRAEVVNDDNAYRIKDAMAGNTECNIRLGWGNASAGTVDGDLDFTGPCKIIECSDPGSDISTVSFTAEFLANIASSNAHVTITMANGTDRSW